MKIAIHQPNYLPWIGFFHKLDQADRFVLLDKAIHSKSGYFNRNKIKTPQGEKWLTVPLKTKEKPINELLIDHHQNWQSRHWRMLEANYKKSPYWSDYKAGFEEIYRKEWDEIAPLNIILIKQIAGILDIRTEIMLESDFQIDFGRGNSRNVNIVRHLGGKIYISGTGARAYNDADEFKNHDIELVYQKFQHPVYPQHWGGFLPNLSVMDIIFNCGPDAIKMIRNGSDDN